MFFVERSQKFSLEFWMGDLEEESQLFDCGLIQYNLEKEVDDKERIEFR